MTLQKLASICGCSVSTVSKAFSNSSEISEKTRAKIFEEAKKTGCFSKYYAPKLQKRVFALICPEVSSPYYAAVIEALNKIVTSNGDILLISVSAFSQSNTDDTIDYYINFHHVDGIIFAFTNPKRSRVLKDIPTVILESLTDSTFCDCVNVSYAAGIQESVKYFKEMGHTKIGYIGEYLTAPTLSTFKNALSDNNLTVNDEWMITSTKRKSEAGYDGLDILISQSARPTAVFCAYDSIAFGAIKRARDSHLEIPDDFSIIAKDNVPLGEYFSPALTSIALPIDELAATTLNLLYSRIKAPYKAYQAVSIQSTLVIRDSVKKL